MIKESESMMVEFQQKEMRDMNKQLKHDNEKLIQEIKDLKADYALEKKIAEDKHRVEVEDL
jgi:cell division protein FtsB